MRYRSSGNWTLPVHLLDCHTRPLRPNQPWLLPPTTPPTGSSVSVSVLPTDLEYTLEYRIAGSSGWVTSAPVRTANSTLGMLGPGTAYQLRARSADSPVQYSEPVLFQTADPKVEAIQMWRISELCPSTGCQVDYLYNHDAGDLLADTDFITNMANSGNHSFVGAFNTSVTTSYCVQRRRESFADYASCNGPDTEHYSCECNNWFDRCVGHLDTSVCNASDIGRFGMPTCKCSAESLKRSSEVIGRMPVFSPFARFHPASVKCRYSRGGPPKFLGYWYSLPAGPECAPVAGGVPVGLVGCSWGRRAAQRFVHCLLYTSDAADEEDSVDLGGRRIIKKKKMER
eukprot:TRINITY_DN36384_c0_g1_i2.p1 TRINITY_DN36384_c0_g1~~TRINITY_DN36384_c0_g1_i2.p1  ORF type:complete len:342 (-),score=38.25 TRINITY_DN36384_c0_g1_i2:33-1058(-)